MVQDLREGSFLQAWDEPLLSDRTLTMKGNTFYAHLYVIYGLSMWFSGEESTCQCRSLGFDPWVGKVPWRRKWQPTSVFLLGESHGQRNLAGCSPRGCKEADTTERLNKVIYALHLIHAAP